jgi:DNA-directed RNA polymerase specialized sigma24 family protein
MFKFGKKRNAKFDSPYATRADYCRIFQQDMRPLYLLSFLLTANHARAEQCYVEGIENAVSWCPVFKEWARSWSRRSVIQNAIRLVLIQSPQDEVRDLWYESPVSAVIDVVTRLAPLERFAFVMTVLERYSDRECSLLLNCTVKKVIDARSQALRTLAGVDPVFTDAREQAAPQPNAATAFSRFSNSTTTTN